MQQNFLKKSPLILLHSVQLFNPSLIIPENKGVLLKTMKPLLKHLHMLKGITVRIGDRAYDQYSDFIDRKRNLSFWMNRSIVWMNYFFNHPPSSFPLS